jgi:hypothetical protein
MKNLMKGFVMLSSLLYMGCPDISPVMDTNIFFTNQTNDTLRFLLTGDVAYNANDTTISENLINIIFSQIQNPEILLAGDSIVVTERNEYNLRTNEENAFYSKYLIYNIDTILHYNLTKEQVRQTYKGVTSYVIKNTYTDFEAINFTLTYPKK